MSIVKPYTFVAGNKARANEVNEDFDVLYQQVNANITNIANVEGDIQTLSSTKANVNGDSTQRFAVADPVSSGDAVNKRTLFRQIGNSIDYIGGLTISKDSGSPNDTILIDPGAAYDSTKAVVLTLDVITSKQNTTQSASATYYVYIIGNATGSSIDILISTEPSVPTLPAGYTLYRKIGSYITDSSANINTISSYGIEQGKPNGIYFVEEQYTNGGNGYRVYSDGWCEQWGTPTLEYRSELRTYTVSLFKQYKDANYNIQVTTYQTDWHNEWSFGYNGVYSTQFNILYRLTEGQAKWYTCGYIR